MLEQLDPFASAVRGAQCGTVFYAELNLLSGELRYACAGHVPALIARTGHGEFLWQGRGPPIGVSQKSRPAAATAMLQSGDVVILYSDGLIERRGESIDVGLRRLADAATVGGDPAPSLESMVDAVLLDGGGDDVCLLRARYVRAEPQDGDG